MVPPAISPEALIVVLPRTALLCIKKRLIAINALEDIACTKLTKPDLIIQSIAQLYATPENSIFVALIVGV
jgi:hypothetical protein